MVGIDAIERKVDETFSRSIIEPSVVKEQIIKTATEVTNLLMRVDDVFMAKPAMLTHTHKTKPNIHILEETRNTIIILIN